MTENIHTAINAIMKDVGYVQKEKKAGLQYTFASESALIQALRPSMVENGVYASVVEISQERSSYNTKSGTTMTSTVAHGVVRFTHAPSDTHIDVVALGEGADAGDKSANKAMTGLLKYALRQTFLIETGDDPDREQPEEQSVEEKQETPAKKFSYETVKKAKVWLEEASIIPPDTAIKHVEALLELSPYGDNVPQKELIGWGKIYRGHRDEDTSAAEAAAMATEEWFKA